MRSRLLRCSFSVLVPPPSLATRTAFADGRRAAIIWRWQSTGAVTGTIIPPEAHSGELVVDAPRALSFDDATEAFRSKSLGELLRAYAVFKACSFDVLVNRQMTLLSWTHRLLGGALFRRLMNYTIYGQFMGGETNNKVLARAAHHRQYGVYPMFAFTARETHGVPPALKSISRYSDDLVPEELWDMNLKECMNSIQIGAQSQDSCMYSIVTTKVTFLGSSDLMKKLNSLMKYNFDVVEGRTGLGAELVQGCVDKACSRLLTYAGNLHLPEAQHIKSKNREVLLHNVAFHLELNKCLAEKTKEGVPVLTDTDQRDLAALWKRADTLASFAEEKGVTLGIDAEQTYLQLFFDVLVLDLMRRHNRDKCILQNTYQTYLKGTDEKVMRHAAIADKEEFKFGTRVVRGGYMHEERRLAASNNYEDPVNPTYEATTAMYHRTALWLMRRVKGRPRGDMRVLFASHNEDTIKFIISQLDELGIRAEDQSISVAQLLGMRDHVTFTLGQAGYPVHKLIHYGEIQECVAYLSRRMQENRSGMMTADRERHLLASELKRRLFKTTV